MDNKIIFFDNSIEKFILKLEKETIAKILKTIDLLEKFGSRLELPHSRKVDKNLFELRIYGHQKIRIFYTFSNKAIVLLHIFLKKTSQTPKKELKTANLKMKRLR